MDLLRKLLLGIGAVGDEQLANFALLPAIGPNTAQRRIAPLILYMDIGAPGQ